MVAENELDNDELFFRLNRHASQSAMQFSLLAKDRPSPAPDVIWTINLLIQNGYLHGALAYLGMHTLDKVTDGSIDALLNRLKKVGGKLLSHLHKPKPEPTPPDIEREIDDLTNAFRIMLLTVERERLRQALTGGDRESADFLANELKVPRDKAEALARLYGTDIAEWLRERRRGETRAE
jgi:hypothetical protein